MEPPSELWRRSIYSFFIFRKRLEFVFFVVGYLKKMNPGGVLWSFLSSNQFNKIKNLFIETIAPLVSNVYIFGHKFWKTQKMKDLHYSGVWDLPVNQILSWFVLNKSDYITFYKTTKKKHDNWGRRIGLRIYVRLKSFIGQPF